MEELPSKIGSRFDDKTAANETPTGMSGGENVRCGPEPNARRGGSSGKRLLERGGGSLE